MPRQKKIGAILAACVLLAFLGCAKKKAAPAEVHLVGCGATFPKALYDDWFARFDKQDDKVGIEYTPNGSGEGIKQFLNGKVDFGASDAAMTDEEMASAPGGAQLVPTTGGMIVLVYNLPDVPKLKLSRQAYADIFMGKITRWNAPAIADTNPDVRLPDREIILVVRADGSGTTYQFTDHLSAVSPQFKDKFGVGKTVDWPHQAMRAPGNPGVGGLVQRTPGAIGYVDFGTCMLGQMTAAWLENKSGTYVEPLLANGAKALAAVELPENMRLFAPDPDGKDSYPIAGFTWLIVRKKYDDPKKAGAIRHLLNWCLLEGTKDCERLGYIQLDPKTIQHALAVVRSLYEASPN